MKMSTVYLVLATTVLCGCASTSVDQLYYDAAKSVSKDQTITQSACWAMVGEIAKNSDDAGKMVALSLAEKCRTEPIKVLPPKKSLFGL